jgi:hypothetical protein
MSEQRYVPGKRCECGLLYPTVSYFLPIRIAPTVCPTCGSDKMESRALLMTKWTTGRFFKTVHVEYEAGRARTPV